jgi:hypothetical protein
LVTVAATPLTCTASLAAVVLKFVPVMVTEVPTGPLVGTKLVIVGGVVTVKEPPLVAVRPPTATVTVPVVAPLGTVTTSCVPVAEVTVAEVPLNLTVLFVLVVLKFAPAIVTEVPTGPLVGEKLAIVGGTVTVKELLLVAVPLPTVTVIFPVVEPLGTVTTN